MRALTVIPRRGGTLRLEEVPEPAVADGAMVVEALALGICGTDAEIMAGDYGWPPPGQERLIIGHESVGRVREAPAGSGYAVGDLVVPIVRRPDPVPCRYCAIGEWDMCRNGRYTERGIKERDGYGSEWYRIEPEFAVPVSAGLGLLAVLVEPASVVAKAWDHAEQIGRRSAAWQPETALVTGAGPIGLLAAMMGRQRGLAVHVFDRVVDGPKPQLVEDLGARYHGGELASLGDLAPDIIIECTGATPVIVDAVTRSAPSGIVCLAGISSGGHAISLNVDEVNRRMVLENDAVFGSVNASRSHYEAAAAALASAEPSWLSGVISRRVPIDQWESAFVRQPDDVKVVITFDAVA